MATSVKQMMEAANAAVPRITPAQAREMIAKGNTLVVDVRDAPEVEKSGKVLKDMGYGEVYNLGAFKDWAEGGGAVDKPGEPGR